MTGSFMQQQWYYDLIMWGIIFSHRVNLKSSTLIPCPVDCDGIVSLKPLHTIGKVSVNASILYKNQ